MPTVPVFLTHSRKAHRAMAKAAWLIISTILMSGLPVLCYLHVDSSSLLKQTLQYLLACSKIASAHRQGCPSLIAGPSRSLVNRNHAILLMAYRHLNNGRQLLCSEATTLMMCSRTSDTPGRLVGAPKASRVVNTMAEVSQPTKSELSRL